MLNRFSPDTFVRAVGQNGVHTESLDPTVLLATSEFLDLYVGHRAPVVSPFIRGFAPALWNAITGSRPVRPTRPLHPAMSYHHRACRPVRV